MLRGVAVTRVRWDLAADALESLMGSGAVERALILGWHPLELIGVHRTRPHDHPSRAGLIFSMRSGDTVADVRDSGCIIAYGNVRHIWKRSGGGAGRVFPVGAGGLSQPAYLENSRCRSSMASCTWPQPRPQAHQARTGADTVKQKHRRTFVPTTASRPHRPLHCQDYVPLRQCGCIPPTRIGP